MSDFLNRISNYSAKRLALLADDLQSRLEALERARRESIAIVGIGCRFPGGVTNLDQYWTLLAEGIDAISEVPADRWDIDTLYDPDPDAPGRMSTRWGGFVGEVDRFDPHLFGISPREARNMDPQQRLLLEVTWEALEHAGIAPTSLQGTRTAVYIGLSAADYYQILHGDGMNGLDAYTASGTAHSIASGRLSYVLGTHGASVSIDTACSSSLVAIHHAVQSLRSGDSSMALAGGVNLILGPDVTIALSKARMMAPDGRCKAFDSRADGFVRGEGCGMLVLKRLSDAVADGNRILAVIRGSAINQDGRSNGLTAPNGPAQEMVLREALVNAGIASGEVGFVEAHGTGTSLGDPIEVQALGAVYGAGRTVEAPLWIGSVKANIGHLEACAGVASLIKLVLALHHGEIPRQLHLQNPNPHIAWDEIPVRAPTANTPWPAQANGARIGGISSFGFSGTNVHLLVEAPAAPGAAVDSTRAERPLHVLAISARDEASLDDLVARYRALLQQDVAPFADIAHAANVGRAHLAQRRIVVAADNAAAVAALTAASAPEGAIVLGGAAPPVPPRIAFLFTGQGSQYAGMARDLFASHPVFRETLEDCARGLEPLLPLSLLDVLWGRKDESGAVLIDDTLYTQPCLFAVEYALANLWMSWGVRPSFVMGHSVGEIVAACVAGVLRLEDALKLVATRARLMSALPRGGSMVALQADESQVCEALGPDSRGVCIAAVNGPQNVVISGPEAAVAKVARRLEEAGIRATRLNVSHAFHSSMMAPMQAAFLDELRGLEWQSPGLDLVSNVTGKVIGAQLADPRYWVEHVLAPVRFGPAVEELGRLGCDVLLEIGPHPTLLAMAGQVQLPRSLPALPSLRRNHDEWFTLLSSAAHLYALGAPIDWQAFDAPFRRLHVDVPTYPFRRDRYWTEVAAKAAPAPAADSVDPRLAALLYEVRWPEEAGARIPRAPGEIAASMAPVLREMAGRNGIADYARFVPELDRYAAALVARALQQLGVSLGAGSWIARSGLRQRLEVLPRHDRLLARMLAILCEDGFLVPEADGWRVRVDAPALDVQQCHGELLARYPDCAAELNLTMRCGAELASVLRGKGDPLALLFPGGSLADTEALYRKSPPARTYNALIGEIAAAVESGHSRPLRVLEIGAGTGSTTGYVLERLGPNVEYTFTDVSPLFLNRAKQRFAGRGGMRYATLDIGTDPGPQGFRAAAYDLVIGANVLHATADLDVTMRHVRSLLAPGGSLVLLEGTSPQRFGDLTVGLLDGWWAYTDTDRRSYALMPRAGWLELFTRHDLLQGVAIPGDTDDPVLVQQAVFVASAPRAAETGAETQKSSRWAIIPDRGGMARLVADALSQRGAEATVLPGNVDPADEKAWRTALAVPRDGVIFLSALDLDIADDTAVDAVLSGQENMIRRGLRVVQALASGTGLSQPRLVLVTRGAQSVLPGEAANPAQATLWGLGHVVALEHPELGCNRIDLDPSLPASEAAALLASRLLASSPEDQAACRRGSWHSRRIAPLQMRGRGRHVPMKIDTGRSFLVTGGLRGLGLLVAEWLIGKGARHLVLMGRNPPDVHARDMLERWRETGVRVEVVQGDVARHEDVARAVGTESMNMPALAGVMHAAGVLDDGVLSGQSWPRFAKVMGPKVLGSWNLHRLTGDLDFMVYFSSGASLAGSPGQSNHAAANAFEDALAWRRQAGGKPTVSINWGPWAEIGAAKERDVKARGLRAIAPHDGLAALEFALQSAEGLRLFGPAQLAVFDTDWTQLLDLPEGRTLAPVFTELASRALLAHGITNSENATQPPAATLRERIAAAPANRRRNVLRDFVREQTTQVLGLTDARELDLDEPLRQLGLDSLMAVELRNRLGVAAGTTLPATVTFDHPSVSALVTFLATGVFAGEIATAETDRSGALNTGDDDPLKDMSADEIARALAQQLERMEKS